MSYTLLQVAGAIQRWLEPKESLVNSVATGGSTTTLVDTVALAQGAGRGSQMYEFAWIALYRTGTAAQRFRRVSEGGDNSSTGTLTFAPALSSTVSAGDAYLIWTQVPPALIEQSINSATRTMEFIEESPLTLVDDQLQYPLTTDAAWIERPEQVIEIVRQTGDTAAQYRYTPVEGWTLSIDRGVFTVNFRRAWTAASDVILLRSRRSFNSLDGDVSGSSWTSTAPLEWIATETVLRLCDEDNVSLPDGRLQRATTEAMRYRRQFAPRTNRPMYRREDRAAGPPGRFYAGGGVGWGG